MNITRTAIFMNKKVNNRLIMEYEAADIRDMVDDEDYILVGYVNFDTENKKIVEDFNMNKELFMLTVVYSGGSTRDFTFSSKKDRFEAYQVAISLDEDLRFTFWDTTKED